MGPWIFASCVLALVVYLSLRSRRFLRWLGYGLIGCVIAAIGAALMFFFFDYFERASTARRDELALGMIKNSEVEPLLLLYESNRDDWSLDGTLKNASGYTVDEFTTRIVVYGCSDTGTARSGLRDLRPGRNLFLGPPIETRPQKFRVIGIEKRPVELAELLKVPKDCIVVGDTTAVWSSFFVPSNQVRKLERTNPIFKDMPYTNRWDWNYSVLSVRAAIE